jgi:hypothetical protein
MFLQARVSRPGSEMISLDSVTMTHVNSLRKLRLLTTGVLDVLSKRAGVRRTTETCVCLLLFLPVAPQAAAAQPQAVSIHWRRVPLRDVVRRLEDVFDETVFVDRRVDPSRRVSLDIEAESVEDVLEPIAAQSGLAIGRLGRLVYLGPRSTAEQLAALAILRAQPIEGLSDERSDELNRRRAVDWPRLTEPREFVVSLVGSRGWRVGNAGRIPHDLWPAGRLPELTLAEQLTVLLIGFDLTFEVRPRTGTLEIVPIDAATRQRLAEAKPPADPAPNRAVPRLGDRSAATRQVYTLRVTEQPVRLVLTELAARLNWQIEFDEAALRAARRSLDDRVSFAVKNVDQDELLDAVLRPARLGFEREGTRIKIVPRATN